MPAFEARHDKIWTKVKRMPEGLILSDIPFRQVSKSQVRKLRSEFFAQKEFILAELFERAAKHEAEKLKELGFSNYDLMEMTTRRFDTSGIPISFTIDHIVPVYIGGQNDIDNLCILPESVNSVKSEYEMMQRVINPNLTSIRTFVPIKKHGQYPVIPLNTSEYELRTPH